MSKASKNGTGSGGDERNMYTRSYKSTSNPSKASSSETTLAEKPSESETFSRSKHTASTTKQLTSTGKNIQKNKLRSPVKVGLGRQTNRINRPNTVSTNKEVKRNIGIIKAKGQMTKMKQETESTEKKQKSSVILPENKESTEQVENNKQINESNHADEESSNQQENGSANGLNGKEEALEENSNENDTKENGKTEENGKESSETNEKEEEFNLQLEAEENTTKSEEKDLSETNKENDAQSESKTSVEEVPEDSQTDTESYSVDVVESTTSEMSEATESTAPSENKDKDTENRDANNDAVSYDSSIMLKDVKIKLNDCLKEKTEEENNVDQSLPEYAHKEATFGNTLRKISGRSSIGRMRHITLRDRQPSPNSSLFVNTSSISVSEDGNFDYKILRHRTAFSELTSSNGGTPLDRKRKLIEESPSILKRPKIEESNSLLNASFELLKYPFSGLKRPQVSTPYKFELQKHNISSSEEVKTDVPEAKKWCVIM